MVVEHKGCQTTHHQKRWKPACRLGLRCQTSAVFLVKLSDNLCAQCAYTVRASLLPICSRGTADRRGRSPARSARACL